MIQDQDLEKNLKFSEAILFDLQGTLIASPSKESKFALVNGAMEFIEAASNKDKRLILVTSCTRGYSLEVLNNLGLSRFFEFIVSGSDVSIRKPHPEAYDMAIQKAGADPKHCVVFEDSYNGLRASKAAGLYSVLLSVGYNSETINTLSELADSVIDDYTSLAEYLI
jgi:beta-phosphoglucomutase-like phosphatase (HAD superfamily)